MANETFDPFDIVNSNTVNEQTIAPVATNDVVVQGNSTVQQEVEKVEEPKLVVEPNITVTPTKDVQSDTVIEPPHIDIPEPNKEIEEKLTEQDLTPEQRDAMTKNNIAGTVKVVIGTDEELVQAVEQEYIEDTRDDTEKIESPSQYIVDAYRAQNYGFATKNQHLLSRFVKTLDANNKVLTEVLKELKIGRLSASAILKNANGNTAGQFGSMAVIAATQGLYKIRLYNSGFNITIRPITMEMADAFIQSVDREFEELGRILGGFYHLPVGVMLKQKIADFLPQIVVNSNLIGWKDPDILLGNISYNDYDTILWALSTILFKDGIGIGLICTNKECRTDIDNHYIDLSKVCYLNLDKLNQEAVTWMLNSSVKRTAEDLKHYREDILGNKCEFTPKDTELTYVFKEPSLLKFITSGVDIIGRLSKTINNSKQIINDSDSDEVKEEKENQNLKEKQKQFGLQLYRMLIPWIGELRIKDGNKYITVDGYDAISASLEARIGGSDNLYNALEDFIRDSRCAYFCADHLECPKCHKKISFTKNELVPIDIEYVFFFLSCLMLEQAGLEA